jgi:hypothetical protein
MARTPDRRPGVLQEDTEIQFFDNLVGPSVEGAFNYNGDEFVFRDSTGSYNPRGGGVFTVSGTYISTIYTASFFNGLSGSLTKLPDGTSYLVAGTNVQIISQSNGSITISTTGGGGGGSPGGFDTYVQFNDGGSFGGDANFTFNKNTDTLSVTRLSGSLTRLTNGTSYLISTGNITIVTQSNGAVKIGTSAVNSSQHAALRQLIHLAEEGGPFEEFTLGSYREVLPTGDPFPTSVIWWETSAKLKKIVEETVTYNSQKLITSDVWKVYNTDGVTVLKTATDTITYSGVFETNRTRTIT